MANGLRSIYRKTYEDFVALKGKYQSLYAPIRPSAGASVASP